MTSGWIDLIVHPRRWTVRSRSAVASTLVVAFCLVVAGGALLIVLYNSLENSARAAADSRSSQILMSCSIGALVGPGHALPLKTRYIDAWSRLVGDEWVVGGVVANASLIAVILLAASFFSDVIWAGYKKMTHLPLGPKFVLVAVAKVVPVAAVATWLSQV